MRIGVDIDDTMADTFDFLMPYISEFFGVDIEYLKSHNISYNTLPKEMQKRELEFAKKYYDVVIPDTPFKVGVSDYIKKLKNLGHEIIIITARDNTLYIDAYGTTTKELSNNDIIYDKLTFGFDKAKICQEEGIDLFVDDSVANCNAVNKLGIKTILFSSKSNMNVQTDLERVGSWAELYEKIRTFYEL